MKLSADWPKISKGEPISSLAQAASISQPGKDHIATLEVSETKTHLSAHLAGNRK